MCIWIWLCSGSPHDQQLSYTAYLRLLCRETYLHIWGCFVGRHTCISMRITVCRLDCSLITWICRSWKNLWSIVWTPTQDIVLGSQGRVRVNSPPTKSEPGMKGKTMPCNTIAIGHTVHYKSKQISVSFHVHLNKHSFFSSYHPSIVCRLTLKLIKVLSHTHKEPYFILMERGAFLQVSSVVITIEREKRVLGIAISLFPVTIHSNHI